MYEDGPITTTGPGTSGTLSANGSGTVTLSSLNHEHGYSTSGFL